MANQEVIITIVVYNLILICIGLIGVFQNQLKVLPKGKVLLNYITKELLT